MLVQKMELEVIADRKVPAAKQQFRDLEEDLLYVLDESGHTVHLTDRGVDFMARPITSSSCCPTSPPRCTASSGTPR